MGGPAAGAREFAFSSAAIDSYLATGTARRPFARADASGEKSCKKGKNNFSGYPWYGEVRRVVRYEGLG